MRPAHILAAPLGAAVACAEAKRAERAPAFEAQ